MRVRVVHKYGMGAGEAVDEVYHDPNDAYVYVQWYAPPSPDGAYEECGSRPKWVSVKNLIFRVPCGRRVVTHEAYAAT